MEDVSGSDGFDEIETLDDLVAAIVALDRRHAQIAIAANRLRDAGDWDVDGALSLPSWLREKRAPAPRPAQAPHRRHPPT